MGGSDRRSISLRGRLTGIGAFNSRQYREPAALRDIDHLVSALRGLAATAGVEDAAAVTDLATLIAAGSEGMWRSHRREALEYGAAWLATGPVVRLATADPATGSLLRAALAADLVGSHRLLRPVIDLYQMGAVLAPAGEGALLVRAGQPAQPLAWTGEENVFSAASAGRLRPSDRTAQLL